jgi:hypothetical protein
MTYLEFVYTFIRQKRLLHILLERSERVKIDELFHYHFSSIAPVGIRYKKIEKLVGINLWAALEFTKNLNRYK